MSGVSQWCPVISHDLQTLDYWVFVFSMPYLMIPSNIMVGHHNGSPTSYTVTSTSTIFTVFWDSSMVLCQISRTLVINGHPVTRSWPSQWSHTITHDCIQQYIKLQLHRLFNGSLLSFEVSNNCHPINGYIHSSPRVI